MKTTDPGWDQRAFVVIAAAAAGLALPLTGLADHLAGESGQASRVVGWAIVHTAVGVLLVVFCTWHAVLNRRALLRYLRIRRSARPFPTREAVAALSLVGAVLALTVVHALVQA